METVTCACGATTSPILVRRKPDGTVASCWAIPDEQAGIRPGCLPDERTWELEERHHARLEAIRNPRPRRPAYGGNRVRCACGRVTSGIASNLHSLREPPAVADPPDSAYPFGPTTCWLANSEDGTPIAGCAPDERTYDVLERRVPGFVRPRPAVDLEAMETSLAIPEADRAAFAALQERVANGLGAAEPKTRKPRAKGQAAAARAALAAVPDPGETSPAPADFRATAKSGPVALSMFD